MARQERIVDQLSPVSGRTEDRIESLRKILEAEQHRRITYNEASEVGESLIAFFGVLAEGVKLE